MDLTWGYGHERGIVVGESRKRGEKKERKKEKQEKKKK